MARSAVTGGLSTLVHFIPVPMSTRLLSPPWPELSRGSSTSLWSHVSWPVVTSKTGRDQNL